MYYLFFAMNFPDIFRIHKFNTACKIRKYLTLTQKKNSRYRY